MWTTTAHQWAKEQNNGHLLKKVIGVGNGHFRFLALPDGVATEFMDVHGETVLGELRRQNDRPEITKAFRVMDQVLLGHVEVEDGDEHEDVIEL